ncbi:MAG: ptpA 2, partial [Firmicutes bacterium]|nr:ptpA 2 [Bacillota bacterium]
MRLFHPEDVYQMRFVSDPQISPQGGSVAYTVSVADPESNKTQTHIHVVPTTGGKARRVTELGTANSQPRWSPDGESLAFVSDRAGKPQIYLMPLMGGEPVRLTGMPSGA